MSRKPSFENSRPDPRLDPYRDRAARLEIGGVAAGHIFVGSDYVAQQIGGRMWWKTWSDPVEFARVDTLLADGAYDDSWVIDSDLDRELHDWADGRFQFHGTSYELIWLDDAESTRVRSEVFDHEVS